MEYNGLLSLSLAHIFLQSKYKIFFPFKVQQLLALKVILQILIVIIGQTQ